MLKGHVFKEQIFGNQIFALFINTFLNGQNGISNNYKNAMEITYNANTLTIQSGAICIQGRFLEEDTSTDIAAGTDAAYCKLVIEVDLHKQNTETNFTQGTYKIIKSTNGYPELTQTDIVKNNSGIYQYELARFRTTASGITDFKDMRTYLDFESIYAAIKKEYRAILEQLQTENATALEQLRTEISQVEDGSAYILKDNIVNINGTITLENGNGTVEINYPTGFNKENTVFINAWVEIAGVRYNNNIAGTSVTGLQLYAENMTFTVSSFENVGSSGEKNFGLTILKIAEVQETN